MRKSIIYIAVILFISSCSNSTLSDKETTLVGNWEYWSSPKNVLRLQLNRDRTGFLKTGYNSGQEIDFLPFMNKEIKNWTLKNDTLIMDFVMTGGILSVPDQEDRVMTDLEGKAYYAILELAQDQLSVVEFRYDTEITSDKFFTKTD